MSLTTPTKLWWIGWLIGHVVLICAIVGTLLALRHSVLTTFATPEVQADWEAWREDVRRQQVEPGPVQRRIPKSAEPPALVLMRDHFTVSLVGAVFFSSLLYWVVAWLVSGALRSQRDMA
jgi:hypothetical protein